jgi:arylamine N-acetyltransferase
MGFDVRDLAGRVVWGREPDAVAPRTHRLLQVRCDGRDWLVDAGFGGQTLTGVLDMESGLEQATPHEQFRLRPLGPDRLLETCVRGEWLPMYRFDMHPQLPVDFEAANFQLAHDPGSHFVTELKAALPTRDGRHSLRDGELSWHELHGNTERTLLRAAQVAATLRDVFGIDLTGLRTGAAPARLSLRQGRRPGRGARCRSSRWRTRPCSCRACFTLTTLSISGASPAVRDRITAVARSTRTFSSLPTLVASRASEMAAARSMNRA